eukprot:SAG31_NODE_23272_length_507_cov_1.262255_2_plen_74_part_00
MAGLQQGQGVFREFYNRCNDQLSEEAVDEACSDDDSWHPTGSSTGCVPSRFRARLPPPYRPRHLLGMRETAIN